MSITHAREIYILRSSKLSLELLLKHYLDTPVNRRSLTAPVKVSRRCRSFFTFHEDTSIDSAGWLLVDYTALAKMVSIEAQRIPTLEEHYYALRLFDLSENSIAHLLRMGLEGLLPPGSGWGRTTPAAETWTRLDVALGLAGNHGHMVRVYRCPAVLLSRGLGKQRNREIQAFMHNCHQLSTPHWAGVLPEPLGYVVRACGLAWAQRGAATVGCPVDDYGLSWTGTHLQIWQGGQSGKWAEYRYVFNGKPVTVNTHDWFDWVAKDEHAIEFGVEAQCFRLLGLRLSAISRINEVFDDLLAIGVEAAHMVTLNTADDIIPDTPAKPRRTRPMKVSRMVLNAGDFCENYRSAVPLALTLKMIKRKEHWYIGVPDELIGDDGLGDVHRTLETVSQAHKRHKSSVRLALYAHGDHVSMVFPLKKEPSARAVISVREGYFIRSDVWAANYSYFHALRTMRKFQKDNAQLTTDTAFRTTAFEVLVMWLRRGGLPIIEDNAQATEADAKLSAAMNANKLSFPLWMNATAGGINSKHTLDTTAERCAFLADLATKIELPWRAWGQGVDNGTRAPRKRTLEFFFADYMRWVCSIYQAEEECLLSDRDVRQCLSSLVCPWTVASGFTNVNTYAPRLAWAKSYDKPKPKTRQEVVHSVFESMTMYLPSWAEDGSVVL